MSTTKKKQDTRQNVDIKSQYQKIETGIKNGVFIFTNLLTVEQFANKINKSIAEVLKFFFIKGKMKNLNTILDEEEIGEACLEFGLDFEKKTNIDETNILDNLKIDDDEKLLTKRPPIVTIMGHVDHGKTTLLDYIRKSNVVSGEAGGITQHIGAYQIKHNNEKITFIDTPGHAAFTQMRARGANVTDIVVLVVAADDGIKPQTEEAIDHAKAAKVPIIVFINKIDKPNINVERVLSQLSDKNLVSEEWGGDIIMIRGSALTGVNVDKLLDAINILSEMNEYKANYNRLANGVVLESKINKGVGVVVTLLIKNGTLYKGDYLIVGSYHGRIRAMFDENDKIMNEATPSCPVKIIGLSEVPNAGDKFVVSKDEKDIKELAKKIKITTNQNNTINIPINQKDDSGIKHTYIILKTDVNGSLEAIKNLIGKINIDGTKLHLIRSAVGGINENDIQLASASKALIIGFNVKPTVNIKEQANNQKITILFFDIIYKLSEAIDDILKGSLDPVYEEKETAEAIIQQLWKHSMVGVIAGCLVQVGEINRNDNARVLRDGVVILDTKINSLKHVKDVVNKVSAGMECGITLDRYDNAKVGDIIQTYIKVKK